MLHLRGRTGIERLVFGNVLNCLCGLLEFFPVTSGLFLHKYWIIFSCLISSSETLCIPVRRLGSSTWNEWQGQVCHWCSLAHNLVFSFCIHFVLLLSSFCSSPFCSFCSSPFYSFRPFPALAAWHIGQGKGSRAFRFNGLVHLQWGHAVVLLEDF